MGEKFEFGLFCKVEVTPIWCAENVLKLGPLQSLQVRLRGVGACYLTGFRTVGEGRTAGATGSNPAEPAVYPFKSRGFGREIGVNIYR